MEKEVLEYLLVKPGGVYLDATLGDGGHARKICSELSSQGIMIGIDQDEDALVRSRENLKQFLDRVVLLKGNFKNLKRILHQKGVFKVDGIIMDLGISSYQVDQGGRGFSFHREGPLDMRMDRSHHLSAYRVVNEYSREDLVRIFRDYGEEKWASRIASFIVEQRRREEILTTHQLVDIIKAAIPASRRRTGGHPARRVFQALRLEVNQEMESLRQALPQGVSLLAEEGRFCVISYHSLEDRLVKHYFKERSRCSCPPGFPVCTCQLDLELVTVKPLYPSPEEIEQNPRSRSARMRVAQKTQQF